MDPRQSNVGEGSSQGFVPGGNNVAYQPTNGVYQQPPWSTFPYGYQVPMVCSSQGFQPYAPNVPMMNPSSLPPERSQPAEIPEASQHNSVPVEVEPAAPAASTGRRRNKASANRTKLGNFNPDEDKNLVKAWLEISCDPITNTGQKRDRMWDRILKRYNSRRGSDPERTERSLQSRWDFIKTEVGLFASYYADVIRENPSGMTDADKTTHAVSNFAGILKRKFCLLHCWELMKDAPKWQDPNARDTATAARGEGFGEDGTAGTVDLEDGQSSPVRSGAQPRRPMGRDSAKAAKKKTKSDAASSSSAEYAAKMQDLSLKRIDIMQSEAARKNDRYQHLVSIDEQRLVEMRRHNEALVQIEHEKLRLKREQQEDERRKEEAARRREERQEEERILAIDLDKCPPPLRVYYQACQDEILEKQAARRQRREGP